MKLLKSIEIKFGNYMEYHRIFLVTEDLNLHQDL